MSEDDSESAHTFQHCSRLFTSNSTKLTCGPLVYLMMSAGPALAQERPLKLPQHFIEMPIERSGAFPPTGAGALTTKRQGGMGISERINGRVEFSLLLARLELLQEARPSWSVFCRRVIDKTRGYPTTLVCFFEPRQSNLHSMTLAVGAGEDFSGHFFIGDRRRWRLEETEDGLAVLDEHGVYIGLMLGENKTMAWHDRSLGTADTEFAALFLAMTLYWREAPPIEAPRDTAPVLKREQGVYGAHVRGLEQMDQDWLAYEASSILGAFHFKDGKWRDLRPPPNFLERGVSGFYIDAGPSIHGPLSSSASTDQRIGNPRGFGASMSVGYFLGRTSLSLDVEFVVAKLDLKPISRGLERPTTSNGLRGALGASGRFLLGRARNWYPYIGLGVNVYLLGTTLEAQTQQGPEQLSASYLGVGVRPILGVRWYTLERKPLLYGLTAELYADLPNWTSGQSKRPAALMDAASRLRQIGTPFGPSFGLRLGVIFGLSPGKDRYATRIGP